MNERNHEVFTRHLLIAFEGLEKAMEAIDSAPSVDRSPLCRSLCEWASAHYPLQIELTWLDDSDHDDDGGAS